MKKIVAVLLCAMMMFAVGCGDKNSDKVAQTENASAKSSEMKGPVDSSWFNDAVFCGDSVTLKLKYYCDSDKAPLGKAQFFCAGSLGYGTAILDMNDKEAFHPYYKGKQRLCEDCAKITGATKVFLMFGMNDIALYGLDDSLDYAEELINRIHKKSPKAEFFIQSMTPILKGHEIKSLNNNNIRKFNKLLKEFAEKNNYKYLDIYSVVAGKNGYLKSKYCGDPEAQGIHFTSDACGKWVEYLKKNVRS